MYTDDARVHLRDGSVVPLQAGRGGIACAWVAWVSSPCAKQYPGRPGLGRAARMRVCFPHDGPTAMIELNPVRQRITDLNDRVVSLRGYL